MVASAPGCEQGVHLATFHLQEDRGQRKDSLGREKFSLLPPSTSQKKGRSLVNGMSVQMADGISVQKEANCPRNGL